MTEDAYPHENAGEELWPGAACCPTTASIRLGRVAHGALLLYLFFVMFGTSLPFPSSTNEIEDKSLANPFSQIIYSLLFMSSLLCLLPRLHQAWAVIRREKFMTAFLAWILLSVLWSDATVVSFKRALQLMMTVTISLTALLYCEESKHTLRLLLYVLSVYLVLSLLAILTIPAAIDPRSGSWRGMAVSKNHFGQAMVISVLAWILGLRHGLIRYRKGAYAMLALSLVMLLGSTSATGAVTICCLAIIGAVWWINSTSMPPRAARTLSLVTLTGLALLSLFAVLHTPEVFDKFLNSFGRDSTFTGRIELWGFVWEYTSDHLILGCGYGGFWTTLNEDLLVLYDHFIWLPNQSHMGYLDIINELGLVGLLLFLALLCAYTIRLMLTRVPQLWAWFVIAAVILNTQETTLFRTHILSGVLFIHVYFAVTVDTLKLRGEI